MDIYQQIGEELKVKPNVVRAVAEVESSGNGFLPDGQVKILFEPHVFWRCLKRRGIDPNKHTTGNTDILYPKWKTGAYGAISAQHGRLQRAVKINRDAALEACSWGAYQVLGENWKEIGYSSLQAFINDASTSEGQVKMFIRFVKSKKLVDELQREDFTNFALGYNGQGAAKNNYAAKMKAKAADYAKLYA